MKRLNLKNKKFGRLTVQSLASVKEYKSYWKCKCVCGKITTVWGGHLKSGHTQSCGCYKIDRSREVSTGQTWSRLPPGESGFNALYCQYKNGAKRRNLAFNISRTKFKELVTKNCYYCNKPPSNIIYGSIKGYTKKGIKNSKFIYNGLDRINNNRGYSVNNILTSCTRDNRLRMNNFTVEETKVMVQALENYLKDRI